MTDDDLATLPFHDGLEAPAVGNGATGGRPCRRHDWASGWQKCEPSYRWTETQQWPDDIPAIGCRRCHKLRDAIASRRSRNNGKRGRRAELDVARSIPGARKMGPLGLPWDVEVGTYARLQVKKLIHPPSPAEIARLIRAIPDTGDRLRGFVWVEAAGQGKRGTRSVWFLSAEFEAWHGADFGGADVRLLVTMPLATWVAEFVR
jgi:hypothetical protein